MELKLMSALRFLYAFKVLIVPYGIETQLTVYYPPRCFVLIVPYGIETPNMVSTMMASTVLIVPYGIETQLRLRVFF